MLSRWCVSSVARDEHADTRSGAEGARRERASSEPGYPRLVASDQRKQVVGNCLGPECSLCFRREHDRSRQRPGDPHPGVGRPSPRAGVRRPHAPPVPAPRAHRAAARSGRAASPASSRSPAPRSRPRSRRWSPTGSWSAPPSTATGGRSGSPSPRPDARRCESPSVRCASGSTPSSPTCATASVVEDALAQLAGALDAEGERTRGERSAASDDDVGVVATAMKTTDRAGLDPETVAVPGAPQEERADRLRRRDPRPGHHLDHAARAASDRRQHDHHADRAGRAAARAARRSRGGQLPLPVHPSLLGRALRDRRPERPAERAVRTTPTPRLRTPRRASHGPARVARQLRPPARAATPPVHADAHRQRRPARAVAVLHALDVAAAHAADLLDRSRAAHRVAAAAQEDVPGAVGLAAARRRGRRGRRRSRHRCPRRQGIRPGRPRDRHARRQSPRTSTSRACATSGSRRSTRRSSPPFPRTARSACWRSAATSRSRARSRSAPSSPSPPISRSCSHPCA